LNVEGFEVVKNTFPAKILGWRLGVIRRGKNAFWEVQHKAIHTVGQDLYEISWTAW
jgi:hypothetical protein